MKNVLIKILILFLILYTVFNTYSFAEGLGLGTLEEYAQTQGTSIKFVGKVNVILGAIQIIGSLLSVICLIVLGIKYMMGSVEEKANYKKTLIPYVLGAIMVLGISNFINFIYEVATGVF